MKPYLVSRVTREQSGLEIPHHSNGRQQYETDVLEVTK